MPKVLKRVSANGKCKHCGRNNTSIVTVIGEKGKLVSWSGTAFCGKCGKKIKLTSEKVVL